MDRRAFLALSGAALFAGCSGDDGNPDYQSQSPSPTKGGGGNGGGNGGETEGEKETATATEEPTDTATATAEIGFTDKSFEKIEGEYRTEAVMTGAIANQGESIAGYVEAVAKFYDSEGSLKETTTDTLLDLGAGETWELWIPYIGDAAEISDGKLEGSYEQRSTANKPSTVELVEHSLKPPEDEYSGPRVVGKAKNNGGDLSYLEARAKFYADNGNVLASGIDNITNFSGGETWGFEITFSAYNSDWGDRVSKHKVALSR